MEEREEVTIIHGRLVLLEMFRFWIILRLSLTLLLLCDWVVRTFLCSTSRECWLASVRWIIFKKTTPSASLPHFADRNATLSERSYGTVLEFDLSL